LSFLLLQTTVKWLFMSHQNYRCQDRDGPAVLSHCRLWVWGQDLTVDA
jgi:hypothetical protein